jgi:membrane protein
MVAERALARLPAPLRRTAEVTVAVHERARVVAVDQLAAGTAYFGFLALVPVLLLATAIAGFLLDDADVQATVATAVTSALPGLDAAVAPDGPLDTLLSTLVRRRGQLGLVGAVSLVWVALRLAGSLMAGVELAFATARTKGVGARLRQFAALGALAAVTAAGFVATGVTAGLLPWLPGPAGRVLTFALGGLFDLVLFLVAYRVLAARDVGAAHGGPWRVHLPGALLGAAGWTALKVFGATYVGIRLQSAGAVYGTLAGVATVLVLLYVMARLFLTGAVLSAVMAARRAPGTIDAADPTVAPDASGATDASRSRGPRALRGPRTSRAPRGPDLGRP